MLKITNNEKFILLKKGSYSTHLLLTISQSLNFINKRAA